MAVAARRVIARPTSDSALDTLVRDFKALSDTLEMVEARRRAVRDQLAVIVERDGEVDERGHVVLVLPERIEGISQLVRQRRVKRTLDEQVAERTLALHGLSERCYRAVPVLDEDAVMQARFEGLLSDADVDSMFPTKVTWAFVPVKE